MGYNVPRRAATKIDSLLPPENPVVLEDVVIYRQRRRIVADLDVGVAPGDCEILDRDEVLAVQIEPLTAFGSEADIHPFRTFSVNCGVASAERLAPAAEPDVSDLLPQRHREVSRAAVPTEIGRASCRG